MRLPVVLTVAAAALLSASPATMAFAGTPTEKPVYSFTGQNDGGFPQGGLISDGKGKFFGVTTSDGSGHIGVVYEAHKTKGSKTWTETPIYAFTGGSDGGFPAAGLMIDSAGNLYGTTYQGGAAQAPSGYGT